MPSTRNLIYVAAASAAAAGVSAWDFGDSPHEVLAQHLTGVFETEGGSFTSCPMTVSGLEGIPLNVFQRFAAFPNPRIRIYNVRNNAGTPEIHFFKFKNETEVLGFCEGDSIKETFDATDLIELEGCEMTYVSELGNQRFAGVNVEEYCVSGNFAVISQNAVEKNRLIARDVLGSYNATTEEANFYLYPNATSYIKTSDWQCAESESTYNLAKQAKNMFEGQFVTPSGTYFESCAVNNYPDAVYIQQGPALDSDIFIRQRLYDFRPATADDELPASFEGAALEDVVVIDVRKPADSVALQHYCRDHQARDSMLPAAGSANILEGCSIFFREIPGGFNGTTTDTGCSTGFGTIKVLAEITENSLVTQTFVTDSENVTTALPLSNYDRETVLCTTSSTTGPTDKPTEDDTGSASSFGVSALTVLATIAASVAMN